MAMAGHQIGLTLVVLSLLWSQAAAGSCTVVGNTIDDSFFNRCRLENPPGFFAGLGYAITQWINPVLLAQVTTFIVLALPYFMLVSRQSDLDDANVSSAVFSYESTQLRVLNFMHCVGYGLSFVVGVYAVFRQHRPCLCDGHQIGSRYGMPSGDAICGGMVGMYFFLHQPYGRKWTSYIVGGSVILLKCIERTSLGFHSIGQVVTGTTLGLLLTAYNHMAPQYMVIFDFLVSVLIGAIALPLDDSLKFGRDDGNNITDWFLWAIAFDIFTLSLILRHYYRRGWAGIRTPVRQGIAHTYIDLSANAHLLSGSSGMPAIRSDDAYAAEHGMNVVPHPVKPEWISQISDVNFVFGSFGVFLVFTLITKWFQTYNWGYS